MGGKTRAKLVCAAEQQPACRCPLADEQGGECSELKLRFPCILWCACGALRPLLRLNRLPFDRITPNHWDRSGVPPVFTD